MNKNSLPKTATTIKSWLASATELLQQAGVPSARLDAELVLSYTLNKDREWLLAHSNEVIQKNKLEKASQLLSRRRHREPLAYIRGQSWFYGRLFGVSSKVMIPRPESEDFIDLIKATSPKRIIDIGTGSGCLAITAKLELPKASVTAVDISEAALQIAGQNARHHQANVKFLQGSLLKTLTSVDFSSSAIIANLPYVPKGMITSPEINAEPPEALFAGKDGLDVYRKLWEENEVLAEKPQHILVESLQNQHKELEEMAIKAGYYLQKTKNLVQLFKAS